jgi:hypothetical protein
LSRFFFASIGFAVPFLDLWTGKANWKGVVFTLLMLVGKFIVGIWIPIGSVIEHHPKTAEQAPQQQSLPDITHPLEKVTSLVCPSSRSAALQSSFSPALLLGMAMVARREIGLLIIEIGYNNTSYVSSDGFHTAM